MKKTELFSKYLSEEGYSPRIDSDGDITFKREGLTFCLFAAENDQEFFRLALPNIYPIDSEDERRRVIAAANAATGAVKVGKVFTVGDNVWVSVEMLVDPIENFSKVFSRSLAIIAACVQRFREGMTK